MYRKKLIYEQTEQLEPLTAQEQEETKDLNDRQTQVYFRNKNIRVKKQGGKWYKVIGGSTPPTPTPPPQPTTSLSKYVGEYYGEGILPNFELQEKNGKLLLPLPLGSSVELIFVSENKFSGETLGVDYNFDFREKDGVVTGGVMKIKGRTVNFTKKTSQPSPQPPSSDDFEWKEVAYDTYQLLKKAGKWVKEEGGKLYAYLNSALQAKDADENTWDCINKYNENWGYYKLLRGGTGSGPDYFYEFSTYKINGKKTIFVYFADGKFVLRSFDNNQNIPGQSGKWSCLEGGGYKLDYDDGRKAVFGMNEKESKIQSSSDQEGNEQSNQPISGCKSIISCPSFVDYVNKNLEYKVCMKCPEIQNFQNNPVLKVIYFRKLKQNNLPERTDDIFGPIMKSAIEEYQEMNGITKTGTINHNTYIALKKDSKGRGA